MKQEDAVTIVEAAINSAFYSQEKKVWEPGDRISYAGKYHDEKEIIAGVKAVMEYWLTPGHYVAEFEKIFAKYIGVKHAHFVNSGSSALLLAVGALAHSGMIPIGSEIIVPACCFPTDVTPILLYGFTPVFVDCDEKGNITLNSIMLAKTEKTAAVIAIHMLGACFDIRIQEFCKDNNIRLIEDSCDALGGHYGSAIMVGSIGDISTFSFYPAHQISCTGGMICTNSYELNTVIVSLSMWGRSCQCATGHDNVCGDRFNYSTMSLGFYDHKYTYDHFGYNLEGTEVQAAIGIEQMKKLDDIVSKRRQNHRILFNAIHLTKAGKEDKVAVYGFGDAILNKDGRPIGTSIGNPFGLLIKMKQGSRHAICVHLEENGIQTRPLFAGNILRQRAAVELCNFIKFDLPKTNDLTDNAFWVGVHPDMTPEMLNYIALKVDEFFHE